ncbi:MAG: Transcriptional regulator, XRE family [uncultured Frankineae bacterium]|uniref:Transcriptional regulator, XRE family n=1 Tax=uncultured Frankineae bacterium TaxID=437475 RepID=A0A6J4M4R1_9ACTN|nr:MAG: Transcriptional regulator, XRE family [uncultured Frankineae bacterium]
MAGIDVRDLGDFIRKQRDLNDISLRQLARLAGVSNPYLSQIERGLRKPSAEILQQIAKALRISAEALYVQAGILEQRQGDGRVADAVLADEGLSERQKQVLLEIYDSFRRENAGSSPAPSAATVSLVTATTELADELSTAAAEDAPAPQPEPAAGPGRGAGKAGAAKAGSNLPTGAPSPAPRTPRKRAPRTSA